MQYEVPPRAARRRGASALPLVFWLAGIALFLGPFLRDRDMPTTGGVDHGRVDADVPFDEDVALVEEELGLELAADIRAASEEWFGLDSAAFRARGLVDMARIEPGRRFYAEHCSGCHGETGDGGGPAARYLAPRPRNFRSGVFKFTSTPSGEKPLRSDLFRVVTRGLAGASMPDFRLHPEERRWDVVEYVRYLAMRGEFEHLMLDDSYDQEELADAEEIATIVYERWDPATLNAVYPDAPQTPGDAASIARGREVFLDPGLTNCSACHGEDGRGDGPTADAYEDDWGYPIRPRDFTPGVFRAGDTPEDLWRSIATGINGTPMGSFGANLTGEQIWDLVHYIKSLSGEEAE